MLTPREEAVVEFRRRTPLPLDDVFGRLRRHDISRRPRDSERGSQRGRFAETTIGSVHVDACELCSAEGEMHLFLAIDRVAKFRYVELRTEATTQVGARFLGGAIAGAASIRCP